MKIHLKVTQDHINRGIPSDNCNCPIALALKELNLQSVEVGDDIISFYHPSDVEHKHIFEIDIWKKAFEEMNNPNESTHRFIEDFDAGKPVQPFEVELEAL